jgi:TetR/AcrR family transcriptional regulator, regulator of mycofactocin system
MATRTNDTHASWQDCRDLDAGATLGPMATSGPSLRQRHVDRTRAALADAAVELFVERGFAATTVDDIAARADVAPRTFFRYFPTKEAVLFHDADEKVRVVTERLAGRPADEPGVVSLLTIFSEIGEEMASDPARAQLICVLAEEQPSLLAYQRTVMTERFGEAIIEARAEREGIPADDVRLRATTSAIMACVGAAFHCWINAGGSGPVQPYLDDAIAACRDAFTS